MAQANEEKCVHDALIHTVAYYIFRADNPLMFSQLNIKKKFNTNPVNAECFSLFFCCLLIGRNGFLFNWQFCNLFIVYKLQGWNVAGMSYLFMRTQDQWIGENTENFYMSRIQFSLRLLFCFFFLTLKM